MKTLLTSAPGAEPVIVTAVFAAPREKVFRAWTDVTALRQWFVPASLTLLSLNAEPRPGAPWHMRYALPDGATEELRGEYRIVDAPRALSFTWQHQFLRADGTEETTAPSLVQIEFTTQGNSTALTLRHEQIATAGGRRGVRQGWAEGLQALERLLQLEAPGAAGSPDQFS